MTMVLAPEKKAVVKKPHDQRCGHDSRSPNTQLQQRGSTAPAHANTDSDEYEKRREHARSPKKRRSPDRSIAHEKESTMPKMKTARPQANGSQDGQAASFEIANRNASTFREEASLRTVARRNGGCASWRCSQDHQRLIGER
jgi:hypothetical protein